MIPTNQSKHKLMQDVATFERSVYEQLQPYRALYWAHAYHKNIRGEKMAFPKDRGVNYLWDLYKGIGDWTHMCVEKSVQCGLSELFIIQSHLEAAERGMSIMYILPKYDLRNRFVNNRVYKLHKLPTYNQFIKHGAVHRTSLMHFGKGTLVYTGSNVADQFLEAPIDSVYIDEKDQCHLGNLLLVPNRLVASPYRYEREIANPTVAGFGIDERYLESSQATWMIKCTGCGEWFTPDFFFMLWRRRRRTFTSRGIDGSILIL